jgi:hypothetical protein
MAGARWRGGLGERLAGFAALAVALACVLCCGRGGAAWSPDGRRVVFGYTADDGHAALADYDVVSGRIRTLWAGTGYGSLCAVDIDPAGRVVLVGAPLPSGLEREVEDHGQRADVLVYEEGDVRRVRRLERRLAAFMTYLPLFVEGGALWYTELLEPGPDDRSAGTANVRMRTRRLDLASGELDSPFGDREVALLGSPAGVYYAELGEGEEVSYGRARLDEPALTPLDLRPLEGARLSPEEAEGQSLAVGTERLAFLVGHRAATGPHDAADPTSPRHHTLLLYDLAGELLERRELRVPAPLGLVQLEPDDRHLVWLAKEPEGPVLVRYDLEADEPARRELPYVGPKPYDGSWQQINAAALSVSPTGGHLAVTLDSPPGSRLPDLMLFDLERGIERPLSLTVPRR